MKQSSAEAIASNHPPKLTPSEVMIKKYKNANRIAGEPDFNISNGYKIRINSDIYSSS